MAYGEGVYGAGVYGAPDAPALAGTITGTGTFTARAVRGDMGSNLHPDPQFTQPEGDGTGHWYGTPTTSLPTGLAARGYTSGIYADNTSTDPTAGYGVTTNAVSVRAGRRMTAGLWVQLVADPGWDGHAKVELSMYDSTVTWNDWDHVIGTKTLTLQESDEPTWVEWTIDSPNAGYLQPSLDAYAFVDTPGPAGGKVRIYATGVEIRQQVDAVVTASLTGSGTFTATAVPLEYQNEVQWDAPYAYWPMNEAAGSTNAANVIGPYASRDLPTFSNSPVFGAAGLVSRGGTSVEITADRLLGSLTYTFISDVEFWFATASTGQATFFHTTSNTNVQTIFYGVQMSAGKIKFIGSCGLTGETSGTFNDGAPHHVVAKTVTVGGSIEGSLYIDGVLQTLTGTVTSAGGLSGNRLSIGYNTSDSSQAWRIGHVALYGIRNGGLAPERIAAHYNLGASGTRPGPKTQFWLPSTGAAPSSPAYSASWTDTTGAARLPLSLTRSNTAVSDIGNVLKGAGNDKLIRQYVSDPMAAQTISGAMMLNVGAWVTAGSLGAYPQVRVRAVSADGTTVRGTLNDGLGAGTSVVQSTVKAEQNTEVEDLGNPKDAAMTRQRRYSVSLSSVTVQDGDRLVVEMGYWHSYTGSFDRRMVLRLGDPVGGTQYGRTYDVSGPDYVPYVEFSDEIAIVSPPQVTASFGGVGTFTAVAAQWIAPTVVVAALTGSGTFTATVVEGEVVAAALTGSGAFTATVVALTRPANDNWANAAPVTIPTDGAKFTSSPVDNALATSEVGEPNQAGSSSKSVWWKYTPTSSGTVTFDTVGSWDTSNPGSGFADTQIAAYTGSALNALTVVASDQDSGGSHGGKSFTSWLQFQATAGTTYWLQVGAYGTPGNPITYVANVTGPATVGAIPVTAPLTGSGAFTATVVEGERVAAGLTGSGAFTATAAQYVPPAVGAPLVGSGAFTATSAVVGATPQVSAPLAGAGDFSATAAIAAPTASVTASLTGAGDFTGYAVMVPPAYMLVLTPELDQTPATITLALANFEPLTLVTFTIDDDVVGSETSDANGDISEISLPVDRQFVAGSHVIAAASLEKGASATFTVLRDPDPLPVEQTPDAPAQPVPEAVNKWVFQDLMPGGIGTWVMPINPTTMGNPHVRKTVAAAPTTAVRGRPHVSEGATPVEWEFAGFAPDKAFQDKLIAYSELPYRFYLVDHRGRAWTVAITRLSIVPRKRVKDDQGVSSDWQADYTASVALFSQTPQELA